MLWELDGSEARIELLPNLQRDIFGLFKSKTSNIQHLNHPAHIRKFDAQSKNAMVDEFVNKLNSTDLSAARARRFVADEDDVDSYRSCSKVRVYKLYDIGYKSKILAHPCVSAHQTTYPLIGLQFLILIDLLTY